MVSTRKTKYNKDKRFADAETAAKAARKGLWAGKGPIAPWEWRSKKLGAKKTPAAPVRVSAGSLRIAALLPNPKGKDDGNEQVALVNASNKPVALKGWSLRDKAGNVFLLSGTVPAGGQLVITMKSNSMPLNNDGDTITLLQGGAGRHRVSYTGKQAGSGVVVK